MKYSVGNKKPASKPAFDFAAATEALTEGYIRLGDAYEQLVAAEGRCAEAEAVMEDCGAALESIQRFGVTNTTMAVFNQDGGLDMALGLESLDVTALESLSAATKKLRKDKYVAGLEGKMSEAWDKFVQFLKDLWEKIKRWFKELFDSNSKYVRLVNEALENGAFKRVSEKTSGSSTITGITPKMATACIDAANEILKCVRGAANMEKMPTPDNGKLTAVGLKMAEGGKIDASGLDTSCKKEKKRLEELGWSGNGADTVAKEFVKLAVGAEAKAATQAIDKVASQAIKDAEEAKKADGATDQQKKDAAAAKETAAKNRKEALSQAASFMAAYKKLVDRVGTTLVAIAKIGGNAPEAK